MKVICLEISIFVAGLLSGPSRKIFIFTNTLRRADVITIYLQKKTILTPCKNAHYSSVLCWVVDRSQNRLNPGKYV